MGWRLGLTLWKTKMTHYRQSLKPSQSLLLLHLVIREVQFHLVGLAIVGAIHAQYARELQPAHFLVINLDLQMHHTRTSSGHVISFIAAQDQAFGRLVKLRLDGA